MSLVSSADHWLFMASTGGLSAGRINPDSALFPYETEDKITAQSELTGGKTLLQVKRSPRTCSWEPFSSRYAGLYAIERHLYKNVTGNKLIFEEVNHDLKLTLQTAWRFSDRFGFIRSCRLQNDGASACRVKLLDGFQNLLPYGTTQQLQSTMSSLLNAYKRSELEPETGFGIFTLSATLTDRAEPSESLKATVAWQVGLNAPIHLLSSGQLDGFRHGRSLKQEYDIRGRPGAYLAASTFELPVGVEKQWYIVADVNQDAADVVRLANFLRQEETQIISQIEEDIERNSDKLLRYVAAADGLQLSAAEPTTAHHFANVLFNIMRGGIFADGYRVRSDDFRDFVHVRNRAVLHSQAEWFAGLPEELDIRGLYDRAAEYGEPNLIRLCYEYLPLTFSRRHGDPSRPWNHFRINLKKADGSPNLDYQGNWRDIFQNWEPLLLSFPAYVEGVIAKFLNAVTADGYNPYRVMRDGIEWEVPEPDNPWSNIGYWSDHQIIYLQKLLEIAEQAYPGTWLKLANEPIFAYANVPYRIRSYPEMLTDWYDTIDFDWQTEKQAERSVAQIGTDGRLLQDGQGHILHATMIEKLLVLLLAKLANLVPGGGIWMNTQRPEWNDANNALAGKGLSVVTTAYLCRFIAFWQERAADAVGEAFLVNTAVAALFSDLQAIFVRYDSHLATGFDDETRRAVMDALGAAVTTYRSTIYENGLPTLQEKIDGAAIFDFLALAQRYIEYTLQENRREDGMAHTYNTLRLDKQRAVVKDLYLMLEGQVALLSSGMLAPDDSLTLLQQLRHSDLYRPDQHSYMLYPNRRLPGFRQKNNVPTEQVANSRLVEALMEAGDRSLLVRDEDGVFHFNGRFRNADDVESALDTLAEQAAFADVVAAERDFIFDLFETTFDHRSFTGRSGTFFAYEGLGSIYWHMVSKLLLAAQESYQQALQAGADPALIAGLSAAYYDIRAGIGFNKSPAEYGAFPTDPYSHTPLGYGARQPGMTGVVKEEILTRWGELGVSLRQGALCFAPTLLESEEFLQEEAAFEYIDVFGRSRSLSLAPGSLAFTYCQVPIIYHRGSDRKIEVAFADGRTTTLATNCLDLSTTRHIFDRDGTVGQVRVTVQI
ncbi:MAG: hypothetical protein R3293_19795 [Candidatus Promineifilaceae bacterium]|nr:hypothetical protein [Candidatus Promineifilaceae bacterium]